LAVAKDIDGNNPPPVLLCFDGSDDAGHAILRAGEMLGERTAVVLTVGEPVAVWQPYDPATAITAPLSRLASKALGLDEITQELADERVNAGVALARQAGFDARGGVGKGKAWRVICAVADEIDAGLIVLGARGLSRVQSALLGSVSAAVVQHAHRPVLIVPHHVPVGRSDAERVAGEDERPDRYGAGGERGHDHLGTGNGEGEEAARCRDDYGRDVHPAHHRAHAGDQG
jgi:nucleotide-binding universal stress UspA family protein